MKEFAYKGKNLEELKKLSLEEFATLLPSRQRKSLLKHTEIIQNFLQQCRKKIAGNKAIKTHKRGLVLVPQMVGLTIQVHNGKEFISVKIIEEMLGHRLGEFALTRRKVEHGAAGIGATRSSAYLSVK